MEIERWQSGSNPSISVVLATIPSTDHSAVIKKLKNQSFPRDFEILIIIDNEPTDRRCEARNIGLREANADIVAHTDDDVLPPNNWLNNIYSAFNSNIICVEGPVQGGMEYTGTGLYRGCNMAVRRQEGLRVGGWNEEYAGWRDDTEFGWRLEESGDGRCIYVNSVVMMHPPAPRTDLRIDQEIELFNRYPNKYTNRIPDSIKKDAFLLLNRSVWGQRLLRVLS